MSVADLEVELARWRNPDATSAPTNTLALTTQQALAIRNEGNVPDHLGRSLRLVLFVDDQPLGVKRLRFEPDFHEAPTWRREGSKPVNVVPLTHPQGSSASGHAAAAWWEHPDVAALETSWRETGEVEGVVVPAPYRSFVLKTAASLRAAGAEVSVGSIVDSVARWLDPDQVAELREALKRVNP